MGAILAVSQSTPDPEVIARAAEVARSGGVLVLPTDSVYGLACAATSGNPAHGRIFEIKRRERTQTLPWFVADAADLSVYGEGVPAWALRLAGAFWPGALTLVVRASAAVPAEYSQPGPDGPTIALGRRSPRPAPTRTAPPRPPLATAWSRASWRPPTSCSTLGPLRWGWPPPSWTPPGPCRTCCARAPSASPRSFSPLASQPCAVRGRDAAPAPCVVP